MNRAGHTVCELPLKAGQQRSHLILLLCLPERNKLCLTSESWCTARSPITKTHEILTAGKYKIFRLAKSSLSVRMKMEFSRGGRWLAANRTESDYKSTRAPAMTHAFLRPHFCVCVVIDLICVKSCVLWQQFRRRQTCWPPDRCCLVGCGNKRKSLSLLFIIREDPVSQISTAPFWHISKEFWQLFLYFREVLVEQKEEKCKFYSEPIFKSRHEDG